MTQGPFDFLCLSHLTWDRRLFQRPQQLMMRMEARSHRVRYLALMPSRAWWKAAKDERRITFGQKGEAINLPFVPLAGRIKAMGALSRAMVAREGAAGWRNAPREKRVLWIQHPKYVQLVERLDPGFVVYDRMDPFDAFQKSTSDTAEFERRTFARADIVFTGGRSMHRQREGAHPNMHCFPSGIDFHHFAQGAAGGDIPRDLSPIKGPRLGYFGAVDERIDWEMTAALCRANREWSVVFLGPLVGINAPPINEPNFHYLGPKKYDELPGYLRGFSVCLIPWLVTELTRFMSPTKTPEYLAAGRPVVSTPIPDVEADYSNEVVIAKDAAGFIAGCERAVAQGVSPHPRKPTQSRTWDEIAAQMEELIRRTMKSRSA